MLSNWVLAILHLGTGNAYINIGKDRIFPSWTKINRLKWHMDDEDRTVEALHDTNWMFQLEDQLPVPLNKPIFIKRHQWHRLIKGDGHLIVHITKHAKRA
jgi:hypothetical protein